MTLAAHAQGVHIDSDIGFAAAVDMGAISDARSHPFPPESPNALSRLMVEEAAANSDWEQDMSGARAQLVVGGRHGRRAERISERTPAQIVASRAARQSSPCMNGKTRRPRTSIPSDEGSLATTLATFCLSLPNNFFMLA